ncbi:hypothetical protein ILYODFUR_037037 [Ilyodon furcidens]|uniref:Uncharacterized protein n=1 Tax=Ilyodon furcidens TaxID=33524 RepID=A0ABV0VA39_9TELE
MTVVSLQLQDFGGLSSFRFIHLPFNSDQLGHFQSIMSSIKARFLECRRGSLQLLQSYHGPIGCSAYPVCQFSWTAISCQVCSWSMSSMSR